MTQVETPREFALRKLTLGTNARPVDVLVALVWEATQIYEVSGVAMEEHEDGRVDVVLAIGTDTLKSAGSTEAEAVYELVKKFYEKEN